MLHGMLRDDGEEKDLAEPIRVAYSGVRTATHLVYIASWVRHQLDHSDRRIVITDLDAGPRAHRRHVDIAGQSLLPSSDRLDIVAGHEGLAPVDVYLAVGAPGIKPWVGLKRSSITRSFRTIVVDEGIGSYGTWRTRRAALRREGAPAPWATARAASVAAASRILATHRWHLYVRREGTWRVDRVVADEFRRHVTAPNRSNDVLFLSQPWVELGLVGADRYVRHLERVASVVEDLGLRFRLCPHPFENLDRYGDFDTVDSDLPAELNPELVGARVALGDNSTALLNLAAIHSLRVVRIPSPLNVDLRSGLSFDQRSLFDAFLPEEAARPELLTDLIAPID